MKKTIKSLLIYCFHSAILKLGYDKKVVGKEKSLKNNLISNCFLLFKNIGFTPNHIVDIGANRGGWTREALHYFPNAYYTLFEPQKQLHQCMKDILVRPKIQCVSCGVGNSDSTMVFTFLDRDDSSSFIYTKEEALKKGYKQSLIQVVTLNSFFEKTDKPFPDIIKIDAEGLDLAVLEGATNFLGKTEVILIEAAVVCNTYTNTIDKVISLMDSYGYKLFEITDMNRPLKQKVLWLIELVFVLKNGVLGTQDFKE